MEFLMYIGYAIIGALGLLVLVVILWFVVGLLSVMKSLFIKRKPTDRNFITHDELINSLKNKVD